MRKVIGALLVGASALAFCGPASAGDNDKSAKEYAPGQVKPEGDSATKYAPGQMKDDGQSAKDYAPGQRATDGSSDGTAGMDKSTGSSSSSSHRSK